MSLADPFSPTPPSSSPPSSSSSLPWRTSLGFGLLLTAVLGTVLFATAPSPYVVEHPGPVYDTLGEVQNSSGEKVALIEIPDETTYPTSGRLDLLTVYVSGSREKPLSWLDVARAWFDPTRTVVPVDAVYPEGQTRDEADERSAAAMNTSQQDAVAAALTELGIEYDSVLSVAGVVEGSPADGVLRDGDEVLTADGEAVPDVDTLRAAVATAGVGGTLELGIRRDGRDLTIPLTPTASENDGSAVIGVFGALRYDFPLDVRIQLERVGGPSAGMMFALGIYDKLTPGPLTAGEHIAGTGTISADGRVGPIGGVLQKMVGARDAGAQWFLAPVANCPQVTGRIPSGLDVFAVGTLGEAIDVVEAVADGDVTALARCD